MANGADNLRLSHLEGENHIGSARMPTAASNSVIFTPDSSFKCLAESEKRIIHAGLYQGIAQGLIKTFHTKAAVTDLATKITLAAEHAYDNRQLNIVDRAGQLLLSLPSRELRSIGAYYKALSVNQRGLGDTARAGVLFEAVADSAPLHYRAKAMLAFGAGSVRVGDHQTAMQFYREVARIMARRDCFDPVTFSVMSRMIAVIRSIDGDHRGALSSLEAMFPLARMAGSLRPHTYFDYLNALAVELSELGRLEQARRASEIALASTFSPAYREWRETFEAIATKQLSASRSIVVVPKGVDETQKVQRRAVDAEKLVQLRSNASVASADWGVQPREVTKARVLDFQRWKTALEESRPSVLNRLTMEQRTLMTTGEKLLRLMDLLSRDETEDETIDRILEVVEEIVLSRGTSN